MPAMEAIMLRSCGVQVGFSLVGVYVGGLGFRAYNVGLRVQGLEFWGVGFSRIVGVEIIGIMIQGNQVNKSMKMT